MSKANTIKTKRSFVKRTPMHKVIRVNLSFEEVELLSLKTEEELETLFKTKIDRALYNFKIDVKKFIKNKEKEPVDATLIPNKE